MLLRGRRLVWHAHKVTDVPCSLGAETADADVPIAKVPIMAEPEDGPRRPSTPIKPFALAGEPREPAIGDA